MDRDGVFQAWTVLLRALLLLRDLERAAERLERLADPHGRLSGLELHQETHS